MPACSLYILPENRHGLAGIDLMRILITTTQVPFVYGGAEIHARQLQLALQKAGHEAEIAAIPFRWYPPELILDHLLACRLLDVEDFSGVKVDRVIGLKFPAYHIRHPRKTLWVLHQYRTAFDLWNTPQADLAQYANGRTIREAILEVETKFLREARAIFCNSANVARRMKEFCQIEAPPLYHPPQNAELFRNAEAEDFFFFPSRICALKRQELVLEALAQTRNPVPCQFAGKPDTPEFGEDLRRKARQLGLGRRVSWLGMVDEAEKVDLYARCLGVIFPPLDEDYGYITLEAMLSAKPVITCQDSGGPLEFVRDGESGIVCAATPESLAGALDRLWEDRAWARAAGCAGRQILSDLQIDWPHTVKKLLGD